MTAAEAAAGSELDAGDMEVAGTSAMINLWRDNVKAFGLSSGCRAKHRHRKSLASVRVFHSRVHARSTSWCRIVRKAEARKKACVTKISVLKGTLNMIVPVVR